MRVSENIEYTGTKEKLDLYLPDRTDFPVLIYFHGGGLEKGDKTDDNVFIEHMVSKGIAVASVNYRMYPDAEFPQYIEDGAQAVNWIFQNINKYGDCDKFYIGGSSAGGYISMMLCFDKSYLNKYSIDSDSIDGYIFNSGQPTTHFNVLRERGYDPKRIVVDEAAPLFHITDNRNFAPMLIIVADNDMQNRFEQNQLLYSTLNHFGMDMEKAKFVVVENSTHCIYCNAKDKNGESIFGKIVMENFLNEF